MHTSDPPPDWPGRKACVRRWAAELGLGQVAFSAWDEARHGDLEGPQQGLAAWLESGFHGDMDYMARHLPLRTNPVGLLPGGRSVISVRLDYLPEVADLETCLSDPRRATLSRYALGRDYHKLLRQRLVRLGERLAREWQTADSTPTGGITWRACVDSAPIMEVELAMRAGLGWRGKHTLLLSRSGSWFFLGELITNLPFPSDSPAASPEGHCGHCLACLDICPTQAIVAPYRLDARRCISYLTIEHQGPIPEALRPLLGNRIYGCDDCQWACPWNRFAQFSREPDFAPRQGLDQAWLADLFAWTESEFLERLAGSPIRRIGHQRWLRNIAVALGNGPASQEALAALAARRDHPSALVREHVAWAWQRLQSGHD